MNDGTIRSLTAFLQRLKEENIDYQLEHNRDETIMVLVTVPGERWEIEFFDDGQIEIERFKSNGHLDNETVLTELFNRFGKEADNPDG